jgi:DsbC/DsbD-like thiol-disulfide interchange protein
LRCVFGWLAILLAMSSLYAWATPALAARQGSSALPNASAVVKPQAYVSLDRVPRGKAFEVAVVVEIARGFHMNSHKPSDEYLIPTTIAAQIPAGIKLEDTVYPSGRLQKFAFSPTKPLDVYTGSVTLRLKLLAQGNAPLGSVTIPMTLRYQACNDAACLPPVKVLVNVPLEIVAATVKARPVHPELFPNFTPIILQR